MFTDLYAEILEEFSGFEGHAVEKDIYKSGGFSQYRLTGPRRAGKTRSEIQARVNDRRAKDADFRARRVAATTRWAAKNRSAINAARRARYASNPETRSRAIARSTRWNLAQKGNP